MSPVDNYSPPRYQWRLPGGQWRDLIAHPPPILTYFDGTYPVGREREGLAALHELEWGPAVPPCLALPSDSGFPARMRRALCGVKNVRMMPMKKTMSTSSISTLGGVVAEELHRRADSGRVGQPKEVEKTNQREKRFSMR